VIVGRGTDGSLIVRTDDPFDVTVVMDESTKVRMISGLRSMKVDVPSLIPGLRVDVQGTSQSTTQFTAERITFTRDDLKVARDIQAGITPTNQDVRANRALIDANQQQLNQHTNTLEQQQQQIAANEQKIVATSGAVDATNGRIANLDDYSVIDMVTVYFANGRATVTPEFQAQLRELVQKARGVDGYSMAVEGHASASGTTR
jgi:outer membrane protein OmpA-like peptidoglycan-associated protein